MSRDPKTVPRSEYAAHLREHRIRAGLSQRQLALYSRLDQARISAYEAGHSTPNEETAARLSAALPRLPLPDPRPRKHYKPLGTRFRSKDGLLAVTQEVRDLYLRRVEANLTLQQVADMVAIDVSYLSQIETGKRRLTPWIRQRLEAVLP